MTERRLAVVIEANGRYCNNLCQFMSIDAKSCRLFGALTWHHKKKENGNMRPAECCKADVTNASQPGQCASARLTEQVANYLQRTHDPRDLLRAADQPAATETRLEFRGGMWIAQGDGWCRDA